MRRLRRGGYVLIRTIGGWAARIGDDVVIIRRDALRRHWEARSDRHSRARIVGSTLRACLRHACNHANACLWC